MLGVLVYAFIELTRESTVRVLVPESFAVTFDMNLRYFYTHGSTEKYII